MTTEEMKGILLKTLEEEAAILEDTNQPYCKVLSPQIQEKAVDDVLATIEKWFGVQPMERSLMHSFYMRYKCDESTNGNIRQMSLEVISQAVEAKYKRLEDIKLTSQDDEIGDEEPDRIGSKIAFQITKLLLDTITEGTNPIVFTMDGEADNGGKLGWLIDVHANNIATNTRRGTGNFALIPRHLTEYGCTICKATEDDIVKLTPYVSYIGKYHETTDIYVVDQINTVIVGYKGNNGQTDAGIIYCPHKVMGAVDRFAMKPGTLESIIAPVTSYGLATDEDTPKYYSTFKVALL